MSLRILHTADLHLGKRLHETDLLPEQEMFITWLTTTVREEKIDLLIVAGDIFDVSTPSNEAASLYFRFLKQVSETGCKIIITAGNHDSPGGIDAPKELLKSSNISVTGAATVEPADCLIEIKASGGNPLAVIAAVPFLRDTDVRRSLPGESYDDKAAALREGIKTYYDKVAEAALAKYPGVPLIGSGHLYASGAEVSDSEKPVHIGNLAGVDNSTFHPSYSYVALGHIHKPQEVGSSGRIFYSGSPYSLSFSERGQVKSVRIISIENNTVSHTALQVPSFRKLIRFTGSLDLIEKQAKEFVNDSPLPALVELEVVEENFDIVFHQLNQQLVEKLNSRADMKVVFYRLSFANTPKLKIRSVPQQRAQELSPASVFASLLEKQNEKERETLMAAFNELLEDNTAKA